MGRIRTVVAATSIALLWIALPATAAQPAASEHCVVHVIGQEASGELRVSAARCYPTFVEAMSAEGVDEWGLGASTRAEGLEAATFTIGTHYDGANFTGASTSVVGSNCGGGWLNTSAAWNNRISSTLNGCDRIRHYSGANLTGSFETIYYPGGNLGPLNNQTSSLQYLT